MTATSQVIAVLKASSLPIEAQGFVLTIFKGEVGDTDQCGNPVTNPWACEFGYTYYPGSLDTYPDSTSTPPWTGNPIPGLPGMVSTALGIGQILHGTFQTWSRLPGAPTDFRPPAQCMLIWLGAQSVYNRNTGRNLLADLQAGPALLGNIGAALLPTWPGGARNFLNRYPVCLAMITTPPSPPVPVEPTTVTVQLTLPMTLNGVDQNGNQATVIIASNTAARSLDRVVAVSSSALTGAAVLAFLGLSLFPPHQAVSAQPPLAIKAPGGYGVSTRFAPGLTMECRWTDGSWRPC